MEYLEDIEKSHKSKQQSYVDLVKFYNKLNNDSFTDSLTNVLNNRYSNKLNLVGSRKAQGDVYFFSNFSQRTTDKSDRATVEQVIDPRTRVILLKLIKSNTVSEINGCLSTGKEANVYHACTELPTVTHYAIKIYKTSILKFKDRDKYVTGEYRFRHGYCKSNPRKMVKVWAEKELRNLKRFLFF